MSIKNLFTNNLKPDQDLQVNSIDAENTDLNLTYTAYSVVFPTVPQITTTASKITFQTLPQIDAQTTLNLPIDYTVSLTNPIPIITFNQENGAGMDFLSVSVKINGSGALTISLRNTSASAITVGKDASITLLLIGE